MSGYIMANFELTDPVGYDGYVPAVIPTLQAHGAEILVADYHSETIEGTPSKVTVVLRFPSKQAARAWYDSPEYQTIVHLRTDNSEGFVVIADEFAIASGDLVS
ncbi:unnamed protein product [Phaeothamnion confervicola]